MQRRGAHILGIIRLPTFWETLVEPTDKGNSAQFSALAESVTLYSFYQCSESPSEDTFIETRSKFKVVCSLSHL